MDVPPIPAAIPGSNIFGPITPGAYRLPLSRSNVVFLDCTEILPQISFPESGVAGVDAEWRPALYKYDKSKLSIIQVAIGDMIYIFDMLALPYSLYLDDLLSSLFKNPNIIKSGAGLRMDLTNIRKTSDKSFTFTQDPAGIYEFGDYVPQGLAALCSEQLGFELCKKM